MICLTIPYNIWSEEYIEAWEIITSSLLKLSFILNHLPLLKVEYIQNINDHSLCSISLSIYSHDIMYIYNRYRRIMIYYIPVYD